MLSHSVEFWYNWYKEDYKNHFVNIKALKYKNKDINKEYVNELNKHLKRQQDNHNNRKDKLKNDRVIQESVKCQANQIKAITLLLIEMGGTECVQNNQKIAM